MACNEQNVYVNLRMNGGATIVGLPSPSVGDAAASKAYVDAAIESTIIGWKDPVRAASTSNVAISGPVTSIDGVTLSTNDRVLLKDQTNQGENGIYVLQSDGSLLRAGDADTVDELEAACVAVEEGSTNAGLVYRQTQVNFTLDTDPILWVEFGSAVPLATETTAGIAEIATTAEATAGVLDDKIITPAKLFAVLGLPGNPLTHKYSTTIGDGTTTEYTITHNLNTQDVTVQIWDTTIGTGAELISAGVSIIDNNSVKVCFTSPPANSSMRVVVVG